VRGLSRKEFLTLLGLGGAAAAVSATTALVHTGDPNHGGYPDALIHEYADKIDAFYTWLKGNKAYIGETGVASNLGRPCADEDKWGILFDNVLTRYDLRGMHLSAQVASEMYYKNPNGGYFSSLYLSPGDDVHKVLNHPGVHGPILEKHRPAGLWRGVNFSGGQKWTSEKKDPINFNTNENPGTYDVDYWYPTINSNPVDRATSMNSFQYLKSRGHDHVRIGFRWERIQPVLGGSLNSTELTRLKECVSNAAAAGLKVILDCHNYGGYTTKAGKQPLGSTALPVSRLIDLWKKLSNQFAGNATVLAYDVMNEPAGADGVIGGASAWESMSQQVVDALRTKGDKKHLAVSVYGGVDNAPRRHPNGPWLKNAGVFSYTAHLYYDHGGGNYADCYSSELQIAQSKA